MLMLIAADMWQQKGNGIVHDCLLHACILYRWLPNTFNLGGFAVWRGLVDGGGLSLVSKSILFLSARCVTCVCPYVRSLANAIAMQLRNSNVNSCGLLCT